jgi:predicted metalloprotease with PDZ domain
VKRIRPKTLEPFDFERADMSGELWFAEGFTSYYGPLTLKRAGLIDVDRFARGMGGAVSAVLTSPGRQVFSVVEMSRRAPFVDAATANDPVNTANTFISYYTYGQALALGIDLSIRSRFPGKTLDDWMRTMWREHPDANKPYTLDDLERTLGEVTSKDFATGIFRRHILGKEPMEYEALLARAGLLLQKRTGAASRNYLGAQGVTWSDRGMEITGSTLSGSPLYEAGIDRGDVITDWDRATPRTQRDLDAILEKHKPGDKVHLKVDSRTGKKEADLTLAESPALQLVPYELADRQLTPEMSAFRNAWLSSKAVHAVPKVMKYCPVCRRSHPFEFDNCPYDGTALRITPLKPGEEYTPPAPAGTGAPTAPAGGRGGRRGGL